MLRVDTAFARGRKKAPLSDVHSDRGEKQDVNIIKPEDTGIRAG